jgi:hypothetical protein
MGIRRSSRILVEREGDSFENFFGPPTDEDHRTSQRNCVFESETSIQAACGEVAESVQESRQQRTRRTARNADGQIYANTRAGISLGSAVAIDAAGRKGAQQKLAELLDRLDNTGVAVSFREEE